MVQESPKNYTDDEKVPYQEIVSANNRQRIFSKSVNEDELKWHVDKEDRVVTVIESNNWFLQMDNELPLKLLEGHEYHIPKNIYHRVIKGVGDLIVNVSLIKDM